MKCEGFDLNSFALGAWSLWLVTSLVRLALAIRKSLYRRRWREIARAWLRDLEVERATGSQDRPIVALMRANAFAVSRNSRKVNRE